MGLRHRNGDGSPTCTGQPGPPARRHRGGPPPGGEAVFRCYILPGPNGTHVRVISQRDTLAALGATYNPSVVGKNTGKNRDTKLDVLDHENDKITNDSNDLGGDTKLRFLPSRGGTPVTGYTTAQVIQFLRDWSVRHARGEHPNHHRHGCS